MTIHCDSKALMKEVEEISKRFFKCVNSTVYKYYRKERYMVTVFGAYGKLDGFWDLLQVESLRTAGEYHCTAIRRGKELSHTLLQKEYLDLHESVLEINGVV